MSARAHIIHVKNGMLARRQMEQVPRVGDEIRLSGERYYTVLTVVWPLDEDESGGQRVNIGVTEAKS